MDERGQTPWLPLVLAVPVAAFFAMLVYGWKDWSTLAVAVLVACGAWVSGGLLGFLFGIPRSFAAPERVDDEGGARPGYRPNTNLEQISDWLTKILVGVGLVQFTAFATHLGDLVNFLGPAFGDQPFGEAFAGAILVTFGIGGFMSFYLFTRIYLGRAFAQADESVVMRVVREVHEVQQAQEKRDVEALSLVLRQLDPEPGAPLISQTDLNAAVTEASVPVKIQIFYRARDQRRRTLDTDKASMERTIPVFHALIASDPQRQFHRNHGQLGFALKDKEEPDLVSAEEALTEAIDIREAQKTGGFLLYEFNRAVVRIERHGPNPPNDVRAAIETDLRAAEASPFLRRTIAANPVIQAFRGAA